MDGTKQLLEQLGHWSVSDVAVAQTYVTKMEPW